MQVPTDFDGAISEGIYLHEVQTNALSTLMFAAIFAHFHPVYDNMSPIDYVNTVHPDVLRLMFRSAAKLLLNKGRITRHIMDNWWDQTVQLTPGTRISFRFRKTGVIGLTPIQSFKDDFRFGLNFLKSIPIIDKDLMGSTTFSSDTAGGTPAGSASTRSTLTNI